MWPSHARAKNENQRIPHMIRRFLCLLLIPLMLANQGLCFAHAHHGTDFAESEGHALRPHYHVGGHVHLDSTHNHDQHSDHSHGDLSGHVLGSDEHGAALPQAMTSGGEHDSDAVYCGDPVTFARDRNTRSVLSAKDVTVSALHCVSNQSDGLLRLGPLRGQPPSVFEVAFPIYLRTLSLRI